MAVITGLAMAVFCTTMVLTKMQIDLKLALKIVNRCMQAYTTRPQTTICQTELAVQ